MRLSDYAVGRDNNFNLIRFLAALSVLFGHSVGVLGLPSAYEFFFDHLGLSLAEMAVDVFFVTSGFLVTASLINRGNLIAFLWARVLRIYPALWVMLALTVFVLAPALTTLPLADYLSAPKTWDYVAKCATLIGGVRYSLPGVFETMPLKGEFNGSLWTLPIEFRLYLYLAAGWLVFALLPAIRVRALALIVALAAAAFLVTIVRGRLSGAAFNAADIRIFMFLAGSGLYLWRDRVPLNRAFLFAAPAALLLASFDKSAFFVAYALLLAPLVLHLAYLPKGRVRAFNRLGRLFLRRLHLGLPDPADAGVPLPRHAARRAHRRRRRPHRGRRRPLLVPDRGACAGAEGRCRQGDVARARSQPRSHGPQDGRASSIDSRSRPAGGREGFRRDSLGGVNRLPPPRAPR